ncbi:MAG: tetratricopeptide repeat protein, partial [bacterium]
EYFEPDYSGDFARGVIGRMPRDAVFLIRGGGEPHRGGPHRGEPLLNYAAAQRLERLRPDVRVVYPEYFSSGGYRELLRGKWGGGLALPTEGEYVRISEEVMATVLGAEGGMGKLMEERMNEMAGVVAEEAVAWENAVFREVYFSSVGHMVETRQMRAAGFVPEYFAFRLALGGPAVFDVGRTLELGESPMRRDRAAAGEMGRYFADIGENFFKNRETPRAEEFLKTAAGCDDGSARVYFFLGLIHKEAGRYEEATEEFNRARGLLEAGRGTGGLLHTTRVFMLARIYQELGISVEADKLFDRMEK